ncbi:MAG TPA: hypothetical protein VIN06_17425 [Devosia sp.]
MKRTPHKLAAVLAGNHMKAILRGGTFHRVQVLLQEGQTYIEHCGLNYKVTRQKDSMGRIICTWSKS